MVCNDIASRQVTHVQHVTKLYKFVNIRIITLYLCMCVHMYVYVQCMYVRMYVCMYHMVHMFDKENFDEFDESKLHRQNFSYRYFTFQ